MQQVLARRTVQAIGKKQFGLRLGSTAPAVKPENAVVSAELPLELKNKCYPWLGDREIIGNGEFNQPIYLDSVNWPCPGIRFGKNSPELRALRQKETGDWKSLTKDEKMQLYRASFRMSFSEFTAYRGSWKEIWGYTLFFLGLACFMSMWQEYIMHPPLEFDEKADFEYVVNKGIQQKRTINKYLYDYEQGKWRE